MAPITKKPTWSELNKTRKEEKRKWKEINFKKKLEKVSTNSRDAEQPEIEVKNLSTIAIAVPGSILETAQSPELRTLLCGQIARAACIFKIDEIVIFDDYSDEPSAKKSSLDGLTNVRESCVQMGRILQYLECPQYLRKHFFPIHKDLKYCGILHPLNAPHHLTKDEEFEYREGVITDKSVKNGKGSLVNVGLAREVQIDKLLTPGLRCTVKMLPTGGKKLKGLIVSPTSPKNHLGVYWGYTIRLATSLSKVFSQSPHKNGYDLTIGTSDKGSSIDEFQTPSYTNILIVFGGVEGLEVALENDDNLKTVDDPKLLFDFYLNTAPEQGSKTIRTEEAIFVTLSALRAKLKNHLVSAASTLSSN